PPSTGISMSRRCATSRTSSRRRRAPSASPPVFSSRHCRRARPRAFSPRRRPKGSGSRPPKAWPATRPATCPWPSPPSPGCATPPACRAAPPAVSSVGMLNAAGALLDEAVREGHGARPALRTSTGEVSYADLLAQVQRAAAGLRARGVGRGDRVGLLLPDGLAWAATFLGAVRIGAVAMPLNTRLPGAGLVSLFADARPRVLVADPSLLADLGDPVTAGIPHVLSFDALRAPEGASVAPEPVGPDAMAVWMYTSGTTGTPKAAIHLHRNLVAGHHYAQSIVGLRADDRVLATSRLFFAYALGNALLNPLLARATACLTAEWPTAETLGALLREHRPTLLFSVPTFYARVLAAGVTADAMASVRACVSAGERLAAEVDRAWRAGGELSALEPVDGIAPTEPIFMVLSSRAGASRPGTTGGPVPGSEARLLDAEGRPVAARQQGGPWVETPSVGAG